MRIEDPLIGRQLANFRIERMLGRGGMAAVYYGWDIKLERPVAIKVIDAQYRRDRTYAERFVREARAVAAWQHPNILQVHYADDEDGIYYYVMEYIHGPDLEQLMKQYAQAGERIPVEDVLHIGKATASALDYAHRKGVIHRDVKPSNIMIAEDGRVVLADFGLAMYVGEGSLGQVFGSPQYIAPEQARNSAGAVAQSDLYSLGVMLYQMLTGALPFDDPSPTALALQHVTLEPPPPRQVNPDLSLAVEAVLLRALRKSPQERYPSGKALMDALEQAIQGVVPTAPFTARPAPTQEITTPRSANGGRQVPLAEKVSRYVAAHPLPAAGQGIGQGPPPPAARQSRSDPFFWWGIGFGALLLIAGLFFALNSLVFKRGPAISEATKTQTPAGVALISTATPISRPALTSSPADPSSTTTLVQPSATAIPSTTASATSPPPTATQPAPTATAEPTSGPPPGSADGDRFELYYNDASLYFKNLSGKDRSIFPIAFERLGKDDKPLDRFDGWRWGNIYSNFRTDYCMVLRIINRTDYLDPKACKNRELVYRTPTSEDSYIFWTKDKDSKEFRVLWRNKEVGRCKIAKGSCEVYLPKE
jgi:serine/threonine protein kinase